MDRENHSSVGLGACLVTASGDHCPADGQRVVCVGQDLSQSSSGLLMLPLWPGLHNERPILLTGSGTEGSLWVMVDRCMLVLKCNERVPTRIGAETREKRRKEAFVVSFPVLFNNCRSEGSAYAHAWESSLRSCVYVWLY
ncbi:hypothetical protein RRG08_001935 [Elysia crispata]|uniref:Uncharacterized protein n=1 Tax=Elysia crispata TaxID=231223 RepID=A0AAE1BAN0_9GAST|nr:hypothetical protein RRG08_001935 [Elysia crispata]